MNVLSDRAAGAARPFGETYFYWMVDCARRRHCLYRGRRVVMIIGIVAILSANHFFFCPPIASLSHASSEVAAELNRQNPGCPTHSCSLWQTHSAALDNTSRDAAIQSTIPINANLDRRHFIGGSGARIIIGNDEAALLRL
jgi:hypothetical protein